MNWKTLVMLPAVGLSLWVVFSAIEFGNAVGRTWTEGTTSTIVNGLVMVCFSGVLLFAIIGAALLGVALATRILQTPMPKGAGGADRGYGASYRPSLMDRMRGRTGPGWEDPVLSDLENGGRIVNVEPPIPGMRPMLPGGAWGAPAMGQGMTQQNMLSGPSGAFDAMDDGSDGRYRG